MRPGTPPQAELSRWCVGTLEAVRSLRRLSAAVAFAAVFAASGKAEPAWTELRFLADELPRNVAVGISSLMYELDPDETLEPEFREDAAAAEAWLDDHPQAVARLVELTRARRLGWTEILPDDAGPPSEYFEQKGVVRGLLYTSRILSAEAALAIRDREGDHALDHLEALFRLAVLADEHPFTLATLLRFGFETRALDAARIGWNTGVWDEEQLQRLSAMLPAKPVGRVLARTFRGERIDRLLILLHLQLAGEAVDRLGNPIEEQDLEPGIPLALAAIDPAAVGARQRLRDFENSRVGPDRNFGNPWLRIVGGGSGLLRTGAFHARELAAARAAVAAHRFRLAHGRFPDTPAEVGAADRGPGGPLRFTVRGDRLIVYADGPDGDDDGGLLPFIGDARSVFRAAWTDEEDDFEDGNLVFFGDDSEKEEQRPQLPLWDGPDLWPPDAFRGP